MVLLERLFGFTSFRPGQREVIEAVLAGRDALAVMPTGGGKSLTYLLPGFLLEGVTVVVSPLISLMQDQVQKLQKLGLPAAALNSHLSWTQQQRELDRLRSGHTKVVFVAPERFNNTRFLSALSRVRVDLLAVDEAHCVSQWGHDFRPDYLRLGEAARMLGRPPVLAVTATATRQVRGDIAGQLALKPDALITVKGFDRPNLFLAVHPVSGGRSVKQRALEDALEQVPAGPGIVYCATRKNCEQVAKALRGAAGQPGKRLRVGVYHAGLPDSSRRRTQERFFADGLDVVVATNAFGLGIDKQDLTWVAHYDLPGSLEAYYQEAGRAGRDGRQAACALVFAPQDIHLQRFFIESSYPEKSLVRQVARLARRHGAYSERIARKLPERASSRAVESALRLLEQAGGDVDRVDFDKVRARAQHEEQLLERLIGYAYGRRCRRDLILSYFGADDPLERCQACDNCTRPASLNPVTSGDPVRDWAKRQSAAATKTRARGETQAKGGRTRSSRARTTQAAPEAPLEPPSAAESRLIGKLRALRVKLAKRGRMPAYRVFHDRTMEELARARPQTRKALLEVYGLGEAKVSKWGDQILEVLKTFG